MEEEWRDVKGYEGLYQVSNLGRVKSLDRIVERSDGRKTHFQSMIISQCLDNKGYKRVGLHKGQSQKVYMVHRLVAQAFIPNPDNLPQVNHKDEDKTNTRVDNLEWCDNLYNCNYGTRSERSGRSKINHPVLSKRVLQFDKNNTLIREYPSTQEVQRQTGYPQSFISMCCTGKKPTAYGYIWKYA